MDLRQEIALLKQECNGPLSPAGTAAAERLLTFLDGVLRYNADGGLPRGYLLEPVGSQGNEGVVFPLIHQDFNSDQQNVLLAKDIATGWLEELCAFVDVERADKLRNACGV